MCRKRTESETPLRLVTAGVSKGKGLLFNHLKKEVMWEKFFKKIVSNYFWKIDDENTEFLTHYKLF